MAGRSHALRFEAWLSPPVKETGLRVYQQGVGVLSFPARSDGSNGSGHVGCPVIDEVLRIVGEDRIDAWLDQAGIDRKRFAANESDRDAHHNTRR